MGTATNQVMTKTDVNNKRIGSFIPTSNKCIIKKECSGIDLLNISSDWPDNKCVINSAFSLNLNQEIKIYYGILNYTSTPAYLGYLTVELSTSSVSTSGTWTSIGSIDPGTIKAWATKTGYVSCKVSNYGTINLGTQYYIRVRCGNTTFATKWYYGFGDSSTFTDPYSLTTAVTDVDRITTSALQFQPSSTTGRRILTSDSEQDLAESSSGATIVGRSAKHAYLIAVT